MTPSDPPASPDSLRRKALACMREGQLQEAQASLEALLRLVPHDLAASIELADVLFRQGRLQASTQPLLLALRRLPRDAPLLLSLVEHLMARGEIVAARACLDLLARAPAAPPELRIAQANLRFALGEVAQARALMDQVMAGAERGPQERHLYAMLLQFTGDLPRARAVLEDCLQRWPGFGAAAMVLANLSRPTPGAHRLATLQAQLRELPPEPADPGQAFVRAEFEYALFKTLDDLGRQQEAWPALERCNALMRGLNPYDPHAEQALIDALAGMPAACTDRPPPPPGAGPIPIFIVGMPRSGTTLLDRMLSNHSQVASAGEIIDFWRQLHWVADVPPARAEGLLKIIDQGARIDYRELGARYLQQTRWRAQGRRYYVDKLPANLQMVGFIRRALPHAPILHMVRDPMDTCFSNFKAMFGNVSPYSYDLQALAHYYRQYARLARHWHASMPGAMLDVPYASLVQQPDATLRRVLAHCGLAMEDACLRPERNTAPVATPSSPQVRESIHTRGLGQWRHYATPLEPLRIALGDLVTAPPAG